MNVSGTVDLIIPQLYAQSQTRKLSIFADSSEGEVIINLPSIASLIADRTQDVEISIIDIYGMASLSNIIVNCFEDDNIDDFNSQQIVLNQNSAILTLTIFAASQTFVWKSEIAGSGVTSQFSGSKTVLISPAELIASDVTKIILMDTPPTGYFYKKLDIYGTHTDGTGYIETAGPTRAVLLLTNNDGTTLATELTNKPADPIDGEMPVVWTGGGADRSTQTHWSITTSDANNFDQNNSKITKPGFLSPDNQLVIGFNVPVNGFGSQTAILKIDWELVPIYQP